jgi:hypothetical protein
MAHFAYVPNIVDGKGTVENVIVIEQDVLNTGLWGDPADWYQTSYNTRGGVHYGQDGNPDGGVALRANFAGIGDVFDKTNDVFYTPQPYPSWTIAAPTWTWTAPVAMPTSGGPYRWDEATTNWVAITV